MNINFDISKWSLSAGFYRICSCGFRPAGLYSENRSVCSLSVNPCSNDSMISDSHSLGTIKERTNAFNQPTPFEELRIRKATKARENSNYLLSALKFCHKLRSSHFIYESVKESFVRLLRFRVALGAAMSLESTKLQVCSLFNNAVCDVQWD